MTFLSWLGTLKSRNEDITSDALRIADLEQTLASVRGDLARAIQGNAAWAAKYADLQDKLDAQAPLVAYALKRKKSLADYDAKRRGK